MAVRENRLKLTPPAMTVAPRGQLRPGRLAGNIAASWFVEGSGPLFMSRPVDELADLNNRTPVGSRYVLGMSQVVP